MINGHAYPVTVETGRIRVPQAFAVLGGPPAVTTIRSHGTIRLTLGVHVRRCGTADLADRPLRLRARTDGQPWRWISLALLGGGPAGSWEAQVERSACPTR